MPPKSSVKPNTVVRGDCVKVMDKMVPLSVDLVVADPPFNIGYTYDVHDDRMSDRDYLLWTRRWMEAAGHVLKPEGSIWVAICDEYAGELVCLLKELGFHMRNWVIWYYTFGVATTKKFGRSHTHLLYFTRGKQFKFNNRHIRVPSARQTTYNDSRAEDGGKVPDNTWILRPQDVPKTFEPGHDCWYYPRVAGTHKARHDFITTQMPERVLERIILACSEPDDLVLDPFLGSGTTAAVAKKLARQYVGIELSQTYAKKARERIRGVQIGDPVDGPADPRISAPRSKQ